MERLKAGVTGALVCALVLLIAPVARAGTASYVYDALGRVISVTYPNGAVTTYAYDAAGNRTASTSRAPPLSPPSVGPVSATVGFNSSANPIGLNVTGSYTSVAVSSPASNGTATATGVSISYSPNSGYSGPDSFNYTASNSAGTSSPPAAVAITVSLPPPPVVGPVSASVASDSTANPITLNVSGYYTSVAVSSPASHGTASASGTSISYSPNSGYSGADSFTYTASNAGGTSSPAATVSITVTAPRPPVVSPVSATVAFDSTGNNIPLSISGTYTSVAVGRPASHGTATASGVTISYSPNSGYSGPDSFNYTASNSGGTSSPAAMASITVNPGLTVTIQSGASASGATPAHTFGANTGVVSGGSGSYTYLWSASSVSATWTTGGTTTTFTPAVSGVNSSVGCRSSATYTLTVTDTVSGNHATSNTANYSWQNTSTSCTG